MVETPLCLVRTNKTSAFNCQPSLLPNFSRMEEGIPSLSSGTVGSRFVSQNDIDKANETRDAEWKAAYARLAQSLRVTNRLVDRRPG